MESKEKAKELVNKIYQKMGYLPGLAMNSKDMWLWAADIAIDQVDEMLIDFKESLEVAKDSDLHPQATGLIIGSMAVWLNVKKEIENQ